MGLLRVSPLAQDLNVGRKRKGATPRKAAPAKKQAGAVTKTAAPPAPAVNIPVGAPLRATQASLAALPSLPTGNRSPYCLRGPRDQLHTSPLLTPNT